MEIRQHLRIFEKKYFVAVVNREALNGKFFPRFKEHITCKDIVDQAISNGEEFKRNDNNSKEIIKWQKVAES